jgi:hypothetical protein
MISHTFLLLPHAKGRKGSVSNQLECATSIMDFLCLLYFVFVVFTSNLKTSSASKYFNVEKLNDQRGMFEEIGQLKLIVRKDPLKLKYSLGQLIENFDSELKPKLNESEVMCNETKQNCGHSLKILKDFFEEKEAEIRDLLKTKKRRARSIMDLFDPSRSQDNNDIHTDITNLRDFTKKQHENLIYIHQILEIFMSTSHESFNSLVNTTNENKNDLSYLRTNKIFSELMAVKLEYEKKISAIYDAMKTKRMNTNVFSLLELEVEVNKTKESLDETQEFPFANIREMLINVETDYEVDEATKVITFTMDIPIIESSVKTLYKIHSSFLQKNDKVYLMNVPWSYIASDEEQVTTFIDLQTCIKSKDTIPTYYCYLQAPLQARHSQDCLTKTFVNQIIDSNVCASKIQEFPFEKLTFISYGNNKYFYLTKQNENVKIFCQGEPQNVELIGPVGIIELTQGCSVISEDMKLMAFEQREERIVEKVLNITMDTESFKQNLDSIRRNKPLELPLYKMNDLNDMFLAVGRKDDDGIIIVALMSSTGLLLLCLALFITWCLLKRRFRSKDDDMI